MNKDFDIEQEFNALVCNIWLDESKKIKYLNDAVLIEAINSSTSPSGKNIFNALKLVPFEGVKAVILGLDPYPNPNHAHGLAFSSRDNKTPDSLQNIFKVIDKVYNSSLYKNSYNDLTNWAKQGVLLLNTSLTYQKIENSNLSKQDLKKIQEKTQKQNLKIWKKFIEDIIKKILSIKNRPIAMFLWGNQAHEKIFSCLDKEYKKFCHQRTPFIIPNSSIMLLQCSHPSPLSVNRGGDFLKIFENHLKDCENHLNKNKIDWTNLNSNI